MFGNVGAQASSQLLLVKSSDGGHINWTATNDATWLTLVPALGQTPDTVIGLASVTGLPGGTYPGTITLTMDGGRTLEVKTRLEVPLVAGTWTGLIQGGPQSLTIVATEAAGVVSGTGSFIDPTQTFPFSITGGTHSHPGISLSFQSTGFQPAFFNATFLTPKQITGSLNGSGFNGEVVTLSTP